MIVNQIIQRSGQQQPESVIQTISCDRPGCERTVTYDALNGRAQAETENPWMKTLRNVVRVGDKKEFLYCGDECEVTEAGNGAHNPVAPPTVALTQGTAEAEIRAAAENAKRLREGDAALRKGNANLQVVK